MNYVTWKLDFSNPNYGTGPEMAIADQGIKCESSWTNGEVSNGALILGYVTEPVNESALTEWDVKNITEAQALAFCQAVSPDAFISDNGIIATPEADLQS